MTDTFQTLVLIWIVIAIGTFIFLQFVTAPYGRHSSDDWGKTISNHIGWIIMELPALLVCPILFLLGDGEKSVFSWLFVGLWVFHYFNRTLIFPFRIKTKGKQMPLVIVGSAIGFNLINGIICGYYFGFTSPEYGVEWWTDIRFIVGMLLFWCGVFINWQSDNILLSLRKPGETGYKIPKKGFFKWISCPNHFGEIIEWLGFAVMTWALPTVSFAFWTMANLIPRALKHHKWYLEKFEDYPKDRKAIFPFLW